MTLIWQVMIFCQFHLPAHACVPMKVLKYPVNPYSSFSRMKLICSGGTISAKQSLLPFYEEYGLLLSERGR